MDGRPHDAGSPRGSKEAPGTDVRPQPSVPDAGRIEAPGGDLHEFGLNGELADLDQARGPSTFM